MDGPLGSDVHSGSGGDIDSLLSTDTDPPRRLREPYDRHRAHDLRAECYRRGIRPIKKGPNANDNKCGYIELLRQYDGTSSSQVPTTASNGLQALRDSSQMNKRGGEDTGDDEDTSQGGDTDPQLVMNMTNKRKLPPTSNAAGSGEFQGFYEGGQPGLAPVLPMQYPPNMAKPPGSANPTTDLEILSGIANSYTQNAVADGQLCGNCRTVVTDQLMESIRLGKSKMQLQEWYKMTEQRDRDTHHLKEVLDILQELRKAYREAQQHGMNHDMLVELQDDIAFFQTLKERTKDRMRQAMQEARERSNKPSAAG